MTLLAAASAFFLSAGSFAMPVPETASGARDWPEARVVQVAGNGSFQAWTKAFKSRATAAGVDPKVVDRALNGVTPNPKIIKLDRRQSDFTRTIGGYLDKAVTDGRISSGRRALKRYKTVLGKIESRYGVPKEVVVAIWGLETSYGGYRGKSSTIRSLVTLAHDGRRSAFFEAELIEALKILQNGDI